MKLTPRMKAVLALLRVRPAYRVRGGWRRPGDGTRISNDLALRLWHAGLATRAIIRGHEQLRPTGRGMDVAEEHRLAVKAKAEAERRSRISAAERTATRWRERADLA